MSEEMSPGPTADDLALGRQMHGWMGDLFPIMRALTGPGVRQTMAYLQTLLPGLEIHEVPSGTQVFDWTVPDEWSINAAWLEDTEGRRLIDLADNTLHVVGYAEPVDRVISREDLEPHLYSLPEQPDAIPYVTSFYQRHWGFCLTERQHQALGPGPFRAVIQSRLEPGSLSVADLVIPGQSADEVLLSTYTCHPGLANDNLSGVVVATALARWLSALPERRYTYRVVFLPETIGAIAYLARHLDHLKARVRAGYTLTCLGDERGYAFLPSRHGDTLADRAARLVLAERPGGFVEHSFLERGSDERQYCSPGVDLPVASVMRTKYGCYPEYHTSLDDLTLVTPEGLAGGFAALRDCLQVIEANSRFRTAFPCEPQFGKRGMYPSLSRTGSAVPMQAWLNVWSHCDGAHDLIDLVRVCQLPFAEVARIVEIYRAAGIIEDLGPGIAP